MQYAAKIHKLCIMIFSQINMNNNNQLKNIKHAYVDIEANNN